MSYRLPGTHLKGQRGPAFATRFAAPFTLAPSLFPVVGVSYRLPNTRLGTQRGPAFATRFMIKRSSLITTFNPVTVTAYAEAVTITAGEV